MILLLVAVGLIATWPAHARLGDDGPVLEITELRVPQVVEDGSATSVILDCDYALRSPDKRPELVVQWYFENGTSPVYQWIPGKRPQDLGVLKGRLNLDYRASNDHYKRHRAMEILSPTYELSGSYRCKVATVEEEASASRTMIIYTPTRSVEVWHHKISYDAVNVTCRVEGVSPRPQLQLYRADRPGMEIEGPPSDVVNRRGMYDATLSRIVHDRSLRHETIFECVLFIPNTPYRITRRLIYYPGPAPVRGSASTGKWSLLKEGQHAAKSLLVGLALVYATLAGLVQRYVIAAC